MESIRKILPRLMPILVAALVLSIASVANAGFIQNGHQRRVERRQSGRGVARLAVVGRAVRFVTAPVRWVAGGGGAGSGGCTGGSCRR